MFFHVTLIYEEDRVQMYVPLICFPILFIIKVDLLLFVSVILFQPNDGTFDDPLTECRRCECINGDVFCFPICTEPVCGDVSYYSKTCIKRSPLGHRKRDLIRQVTS